MNVFFHYGALGDFVLTLPMLRRVTGRTTLVSAWERATLASKMIHAVSPMDIQMWEFMRLHAKGGPTSVSPAIGDLFSQAGHIVSFISDGNDDWAANVARLAPNAKRIFIDPRPPDGFAGHVCDWHEKQAKDQGLEPAPSDHPGPGGCADGPIVVHPGSGGVDKCWPIERYEELINLFNGQDRRVLPLLGEAEAERWPGDRLDHWARQMGAKVFGTLHELHDALAGASAYVGNDSGPTHLAAQLGLPTVALFGPTDPKRWAPLGPAVTVLAPPSPEPMGWLDVKKVLDACPVRG
jgi:Glycosyltransferase family 9 (heptosyltransferase)